MTEKRNTLSRSRFVLVLICFFFSGAAGLVYQVAWTKALGLVFGHTVYAIATVLAAFMGGLAAGSAYLGPWGQRHSRPVALYGWIEILIGLTGILSFAGLVGVRSLYLAAFHIVAGSMPVLVGLRLVASVLVLFLPTFLMGGTLPILAGGLSRGSTELGLRLGRLYWVNTAGAVAGALAAGFVLLPEIGFHRTVLLAVILNFVAGALALYSAGAKTEVSEPKEEVRPTEEGQRIPRYLLITFGVVGATAMVYELAWSRLLATTLGSSTYAFTLMLATFLTGIALGSRLFESWLRRGHTVTLATFSVTQVLTGLAAAVFLVIFRGLPAILWGLITAMHQTFNGLVLAQFAICVLAMMPTAIVFGFNFPVVTLLIAGRGNSEGPASAAVGRACAANTAGAILGSMVAGFWLVPALGGFHLVVWTAAANLALAVFLLAREVPRQNFRLAAISILTAVVVLAGYFGALYDPATANFSVITTRRRYPSMLNLDEVVQMNDLLFAKEGLNASIAVTQSENYLALSTNGKVDASSVDRTTQMMAGHLGMAFHNAPKRVLIIGFGSGMTVSAVARYPEVEQIDCAEIEPAVISAAPYLNPLNRDVLRDPRLHLIVDDARNFLFTTPKQYDLIISEPSNPWIAGVADLFTVEFYRQVRSRLAPGGMFVQWVQLYSIFPQDLRMVLNTVAGEFPQVTAWNGLSTDVLLLAQPQARPLSFERLQRLWAEPPVRAEFEQMGLRSPEGLLGYSLLDDPDLRKLASGAPQNTDDLTRLEYRAPRAIFDDAALLDNLQMLVQQRSQHLPASVQITDSQKALVASAQVVAWLGIPNRVAAYIKALGNYAPSADSELLRATLLLNSRKVDEAGAAFESAGHLDPSSNEPLFGLAEVARLQNAPHTAESLLQQILARDPQSTHAMDCYVQLEKSRSDWPEALKWQEKRMAAEADPPNDAHLQLAELLWRTGDVRGAAQQYIDILHRDPYNRDAHYLLGELFYQQKDWEQARIQLEVALRYLPTANPQAYLTLADSYRNLGQTGEAARTLKKAERIFPGNTLLARAGTGN